MHSSVGHQHLDELLVVQLPVAVLVRLGHELLYLLLGEHRAQHRSHLLQLLHVDVAVTVAVEYLECLP